MKRYYINGKQYVPEKSAMLCSSAGIMGKKGAYFLVGESDTEGKWAKVITEDAAFSYMNENAAGINADNYDAVFGEPEEG